MLSSTSAKTGFAPAVTMLEADAKNVRGVVTTSSSAPIPRAFKAKSKANKTLCLSNQRQWGIAIQMYAADHANSFPDNSQGQHLSWMGPSMASFWKNYLIESKKTKNPADLEIIIDLGLARKCLIKGAQWPLLANKQGRNGDLREKDNNITLNGPR